MGIRYSKPHVLATLKFTTLEDVVAQLSIAHGKEPKKGGK